jgi:c-di-GMP-binding flagellar brake protein YcgR
MTAESNNRFIERRRFPRVKAPVYCRPAGFLKPRHRIGNISLGGLRIYSDKFFKTDERMEIEIFLPDNQSIVEIVRVVWIKELPSGSEALYDVGLEFIRLSPEDAHKLQVVMDTTE